MKNLTFLLKEDIENYNEIDNLLNKIGFLFHHSYKNIPFYSKYTVCKSIGDLINLYKIKCLIRLNKIPYLIKEYIEIDDDIKLITDYKHYSYVICNLELKRLRGLFTKTQDPIYIQKQNEIAIKKAQVDYLRANHNFIHTKQYYMLPETALVYQNMIFNLARSGDRLHIIKDNQLSTSSIILYILYCILAVSKGYGYVLRDKYLLLNTSGRLLEWINNRLKPNKEYRQSLLNKDKPENHNWASIQDYCNYLDNHYDKLSNITGIKYPKSKFILNHLGEVLFRVPSLSLFFY